MSEGPNGSTFWEVRTISNTDHAVVRIGGNSYGVDSNYACIAHVLLAILDNLEIISKKDELI